MFRQYRSSSFRTPPSLTVAGPASLTQAASASRLSARACAWLMLLTFAVLLTPSALAQQIHQVRGRDSRVDYKTLTEIGPWDDRNYDLTQDDLELLAPNEAELKAQIPAFFRVEMRRSIPEMRRTGPVQYPRSALQIFNLMYGGYLIDGKIYNGATLEQGRYKILMEKGGVEEAEFWRQKFLNGEVRITSPNGAAESAIKVNPVNTDLVIAGSNGPGTGQKMFYSTDGGENWSSSAALPGGGTCCDPTVDWSSDGSLAYTATLGNCGGAGCQIWFYRSSNGGQTWNDLTGATPRRTLSTGSANDKEFIHVDKYASSPHKDNIYATWHSGNVMQFARSTDMGNTWSRQAFSSASDQQGIGSDIVTDKNGHVYYFWPAFNSRRILLRKSTNGGASFGSVSEVAATEASFAFPVPSMETREVFVYVSADADLSNGTYGGSIYAAWTDSTASTGSNPAGNHARIQVAYSRNGGATWNTSTPHETADANNVDRWHQWLAVGPDGKVHVVFYDTRRAPNRASVDLFYSFSSDGAQTWSAPTRITAAQSPNIGDSFEFGDYNGLDIVMSDLIAIYTDNRNEGGGGGDSVDVYAAGIPVSGGGNNPPSVNITAPANGSSFPQGSSISFTGTANDSEDGNLTASLAWTSSRDGNIGSGGSFSRVLTVGTHTLTATVTDSGGQSGSAAITVTVTAAGNNPPTVNITAPTNGASFSQGATIGFTGTATDSEDGNLTASLAWSSNRDGSIGSGGSFSRVLSVGSHTITASVTDSGGQPGSAQITITVTGSGGCGTGGLDEDFESGLGSWTTSGLWHRVTNSSCASPGYSSPTSAVYYGQDASCDYDTGSTTQGNLISPAITGIDATSTLSFDYFRRVESETDFNADRTIVSVRPVGGSWTTVWSRDSTNPSENAWTSSGAISLAVFAGSSIEIRFRFDSEDDIANDFTGWMIDDVKVTRQCDEDRPDRIGVYRSATRQFLLDSDGDGAWEPGDDTTCTFGATGDIPLRGDWNGDGDDDVGVYRPGTRQFLLDQDESCSFSIANDTVIQFGANGDVPIIGDWNGDGDDDIGIYRPSLRLFRLDVDENGAFNPAADRQFLFGLSGDTPLVGDWNGDGDDSIGIYRPSNRLFLLDLNENDAWNPGSDLGYLLGLSGDRPLVGDWNGDGDDAIGVYRPSLRLFLLDLNENGGWTNGVDPGYFFGASGDTPVTGAW
ncbi:MAG: hypothetical protein AAF560_01725 [Acidobacteriota bacterium]